MRPLERRPDPMKEQSFMVFFLGDDDLAQSGPEARGRHCYRPPTLGHSRYGTKCLVVVACRATLDGEVEDLLQNFNGE